MAWHRVLAKDKLAFREDLQSDPTLTDLQKRMISTIATHWDNERMAAECSESFIAKGAGTTTKMVKRYKASLVASGRVSIKRAATYTESTLWDVNWRLRGSAWVRLNNSGNPLVSDGVVPSDAQRVVPKTAEGWSPDVHGGWSPSGDPIPPKGDIGAPSGAAPLGGPQGAPKKEGKGNPNKAEPGYARWKIVHAEYTGEDEDTFVAHLRSGKSRKFVLRCHVDSEDFASINEALGIDGEADFAIGEMVQMSTNTRGSKAFLRGGPKPWNDITIVSGETKEDGTATVRAVFHDDGDYEGNLPLSQADAEALAATCGGEGEAIGARLRYRLMPDDTLEFRMMGEAA